MKKTFILLSILTAFVASAQSIEINPNAANSSAVLDLKSTTKGFLLPRMTNAQMRDIPSPAQGLLAFCTDCGTNGDYYFYKGTDWVALGSTTVSVSTTVGSVSANADEKGATITNGVLNLAPANATNPGIVTKTDQTFGGVKTFSSGIIGNVTGNASTVTTNANLTGVVTSTGNATSIGSGAITNAMLANGAVANLSGINTGDQTTITGNAGTATKIASITNSDIVQLSSTQTLTNKTLTSPTITGTGAIAGTFTGNLTGNVTGNVTGNATTVTTNANLTGDVTSIGNAATVVKINGTSLSGLATGILKNTTATGVPTIATAGTDYQLPITLTTTGTGAATLSSNNLNIPNVSYTLPTATSSTLGGVKIDGTAITINPAGVLSVTPASIGAQVAGNYLTSSTGVTSFNGSTTGLTPASSTSGAVTLGGILVGANGGTGVDNTGKTITLGGNLTTSGAFTTALTTTANTAVTLPVTGTLATLAGTETLTNKTLTSPVLTTPNLGTPSALVGTNITGTATALNIGGNAATVTTNANLTGVVTSTGNATSIANGAISNAMLSNGAVANLSGINSGDNAVNSLYSGLVSNATHTGDVTGSTALTIANDAVTTAKIAAGAITDSKVTDVAASKITGTLPVVNGGTGLTTLTPFAPVFGGTTNSGAMQSASSIGTAGQVLTSNGSNQLPSFQSIPAPVQQILTGSITSFAGVNLPPSSGYLICDGSAVSRETYANLFSVISTIYGSGDGSTTFNLPDLRGRTIIGTGQGGGLTNRPLASTGGEEVHTLNTAEMPSHNHTIYDPGHNHGVSLTDANNYNRTLAYGTTTYQFSNATISPSATNPAVTNIYINNTGNSQPHNTMSPYISLNYIIKY